MIRLTKAQILMLLHAELIREPVAATESGMQASLNQPSKHHFSHWGRRIYIRRFR